MAGEEAGDEDASGPPPHPLDRPWVHPSELLAARPTPRSGRPGHTREWFLALGAGVVGALAMVLVLAAAGLLSGSSDRDRVSATEAPADPDAAARLAAAAGQSVVGLLVATPAGVRRASGVCVRDGQVVTSAQAVEGASEVTVVNADGTRRTGTVVGQDESTQLALIRVDGGAEPAKLAANGNLRVGQWILALGGTDGSGPWVATGVVASMGGWTNDGSGVMTPGMITVDATTPIEARGGALLDRQGHVVGVLAGATGETTGGLATPIATVRDVATQLAEKGRAVHGALGVRAVDEDRPRGARVASVVDGGAAAKAGMVADDVVVEVDGAPIRNVADLVVAVRLRQPDDRVQVTVLRRRKPQKMSVVLGSADTPAPSDPVAAPVPTSTVSTG
jgi:S1-C subfamily serine protease